MENIENYDAAMILGGGVYESKRRAEYGAELLINNNLPIIVTGGVPIKIPFIQNHHGKTEAEIMEGILLAKGISEDRIYQETLAQNTRENFSNSRGLLRKLKAKKIAVIDGLSHQNRSLSLAKEIFPGYEFSMFPVPLRVGNTFINLGIETISKALEQFPGKTNYRFYNNPGLENSEINPDS